MQKVSKFMIQLSFQSYSGMSFSFSFIIGISVPQAGMVGSMIRNLPHRPLRTQTKLECLLLGHQF
jgi:hypothetical protein